MKCVQAILEAAEIDIQQERKTQINNTLLQKSSVLGSMVVHDNTIGSYREYAIAIESEAGDSLT